MPFSNLSRDARYREVLEASGTGVIEWYLNDHRMYGTRRAFQILNLSEEAGWLDQDAVFDALPPAELPRILSLPKHISANIEVGRIETYINGENGNKIFIDLSCRGIFNESLQPERIVLTVSDVTERKRLEHRLRHEALHDFLTGLPNKTLLIDRIQQILTRLKRNTHLNATLLFIDVDNFKAINDNLGHSFGDDVLVAISERLKDTVRATDTVSRVHSDEFVILMEEPTTAEVADMFANRLLNKLQQPMQVQHKVINPTFSIGLALIDDPSVSVEGVLGDADIAMYAAKERGKGQVVCFNASMRAQAAKRLDIELALHEAMEKEELYLVYQPIFTVGESEPRAVGAEALLRWSKSTNSSIAPSELLAIAEENGMIVDIGLWAIRTATSQLAGWRKEENFPDDFFININLSSRHFNNEDIVDYLVEKIDQHQLPRNCIRVEVVESAVIQHAEKAQGVIERLKREGIFVSMDDFGTGFSSLSYLHRFPFYALKIDRSFVSDLTESKASRDIIEAIVLMSNKLGIRVVVEGVETSEQLDFLKSIGCELIQGFLLARPQASPERYVLKSSSVAEVA